MDQLPSSRLTLADELEPVAVTFQQDEFEEIAGGPIIVRGPEAGKYCIVSGVGRFLHERRNAVVEVMFARNASVAHYGKLEISALVAARPNVNLPNDISDWLQELVAEAQQSTEIWLFGSRADGRFRADSDWDFLIKGSSTLLPRLREARTRLQRDDVDLLALEDGEPTAVGPWNSNKRFSLDAAWHQLSTDYVEYDGTKGSDVRRCRAVRVLPRIS